MVILIFICRKISVFRKKGQAERQVDFDPNDKSFALMSLTEYVLGEISLFVSKFHFCRALALIFTIIDRRVASTTGF